VGLRQLLAPDECEEEMTLPQILALIWGISAAVCFEAYAETRLDEKWKWQAILIGSLTPVFNTLIAAFYVRDKFKKGS
jgi:hypothetical protein